MITVDLFRPERTLSRKARSCRRLVASTALLSLASCGFNAVRIEHASQVASVGHAAVVETHGFLEQVKQARNEANVSLVASDEGCSWGRFVVLRGDLRPTNPGNRSLCLPRGVAADPAMHDIVVPLEPIPAGQLRPTLDAIDALAAYLGTVNTIVSGKSSDISGQIGDCYSKAMQAEADLVALSGGQLPTIPGLSDKQLSAIKSLVQMASQIAEEQHRVKQLRVLVQSQNATVIGVIQDLKRSTDIWANSSLKGDLELTDDAFIRMGRQLGASPVIYYGYDSRHALIERIIAAHEAVKNVPALTECVIHGLDALEAAQQDLVRSLSDNPRWTTKERARAAAVNQSRLIAALHSISAVAATF